MLCLSDWNCDTLQLHIPPFLKNWLRFKHSLPSTHLRQDGFQIPALITVWREPVLLTFTHSLDGNEQVLWAAQRGTQTIRRRVHGQMWLL